MRWLVIVLLGAFMLNSYAQGNIVLIADPRIIAIPIVDNKEPMVDLVNQKDITFGPSPEVPNNTDYTKMRRAVYEKLLKAQKLLPKGLHFCLYEAYRSLHLQKMLFETRYNKERKQYPSWTDAQVFTETTKLISPVTNLNGTPNVPPHSTGGAIDVYLVDDNGDAVDMGIHPKDWIDDGGASAMTDSSVISAKAKQHRKIMSDALAAVGFINYPTEYWHWSYGDRYWAYNTHHNHAIYGGK